MSDKQIYSTYLLYNTIFIEKQLESDNFGTQEQLEISNVAHISFFAIQAFISQKQHIMNTQTYIRSTLPTKYITTTLDTLQDIIALDNTIHEYLTKELSIYQKLGEQYYISNQDFFPNNSTQPNDIHDFFSNTMIYFETVLALDENKYSIEQTLNNSEDHPYIEIIKPILQKISL